MPFSHLDETGRPAMVDVSHKEITLRTARAQARVKLNDEVLRNLRNDEIHTTKGPVFQTAILAGIMAAKKTGELIPLCHPLPLEKVAVTVQMVEDGEVVIECTARITGRTGVEMEALTGASVAALTLYDMCKAFGHDMVIREIKLVEKTGGKSDFRE
jgi:cyclic pyranopterin monophosphate synthase